MYGQKMKEDRPTPMFWILSGLLLGLIHVILLGILFSGLLAQLLVVIRVLLVICNFSHYVQF